MRRGARIFSGECFPAGTLITTALGLRPVEQIATGDRVLSQNVTTGELTFQPVHQRTLRITTRMVRVNLAGSHSIVSTAGHPFWVAGEGWRVARHLAAGDRLSTLHGTVVVENVEDAPSGDVYNLIVEGNHNFFAGEQRLLVHDNSTISETGMMLPGFVHQQAAR